MQDHIADFNLGDTIQGQNDSSVDINTSLDGREYTFPVSEAVASGAGMSNRTVGRRVVARVLRNKTGGTLAAGEIVVVDFDGGHTGLGTADAKSSAGDRCCLVVDPSLGADTVAANDLFYGIVKGPSKIKQPASAVSLTAGGQVRAGAGGRLASVTEATLAHQVASLGTVVKDDSTNNGLVEVELNPQWV